MFDCDSLELTLTTADASGVQKVSNRAGEFYLDLPRNFAVAVTVRLCCGNEVGSLSCAFARTSFELEPIEVGSYAQPNPFNPMLRGGESSVEIFYELESILVDAERKQEKTHNEIDRQCRGRWCKSITVPPL